MVGKDSDAVLIGGVTEFKKACSCALLAASSAAAAVCASAFDLGDVEKKCAILLALACVALAKLPPFSLWAVKDGQGVGGELLRNGFDNRRGMANRVFCEEPIQNGRDATDEVERPSSRIAEAQHVGSRSVRVATYVGCGRRGFCAQALTAVSKGTIS